MLAVSRVFWVILSVCLHELGHGYAAIRCGDDTPIYSGHMTWNPLVHMGKWSLIMFALFGFTWGLMPVNPSRFRGRHDEAFVAFAGPVVNLLLCLVAFLLAVPLLVYSKQLPEPFGHNAFTFAHVGLFINIVLFLFNMMPVPPLDGARIISDFVPAFRRIWQGEHGGLIGMIAFVVLFTVGSEKIAGLGMTLSQHAIRWGALKFPHP